jgi:hypothetical protein
MNVFRSLIAAVILVAATAPAHAGKMDKSKDPITVEPGTATVVFKRPGKFVGAAVAVPVWDATAADDLQFVGLVDAGGKVAYSVEPGERLFMTTIFGGEKGARLYRATVEAGKTYYYRAHIIDGIWGLEPVRADALGGDDFRKWDEGTKRLVNSKKSLAWAADNLPKATERRAALDPAAIGDANTLRAEDGR